MSWSLFSLTIILSMMIFACLLISFYLMFLMLKHQQSLISSFQNSLRDLTNLMMSKDPMTFAQLQQIPMTTQILHQTNNFDPNFSMDDTSVAMRLAKEYKDSGSNPASAFDQEALMDLGIIT